MERQSKGSRGLEEYCKGGQDPPRAVAPSKEKNPSKREAADLRSQPRGHRHRPLTEYININTGSIAVSGMRF